MSKTYFEKTDIFYPLPNQSEYLTSELKPTLEYLWQVTAVNAKRAEEFGVALNALCAQCPTKKVQIHWSMVELDE